jgi:hypothetical protein
MNLATSQSQPSTSQPPKLSTSRYLPIQASFPGTRGKFDFSDHVANILVIDRQLLIDFGIAEQVLQLFQEFLKTVATWGVPSQIPQLYGFN